MYNNVSTISLRPQYLGKRNWKLGCCFSNHYNHLKLLSQHNIKNKSTNNDINNNFNNDFNNEINNDINNDFNHDKLNNSLNFYNNAFYNTNIEYNNTIPEYIEQYSECNYELMNNISYLYRNLLNSNEFNRIYIKKNSLKNFNNISKIATNKLHKTTIPDNTTKTTNTFNILLKTNQKIIDDKQNISGIIFDDNVNNKLLNNDDNYSDDCEPDNYCESILSDNKEEIDFDSYDM